MSEEAEIINQALPIAITGTVMFAISMIVFFIYYFSYKTRKSQYESIVRSIESGNPIPESIADRFSEKLKTQRDAIYYLLIMASLASMIVTIVGLSNCTGHNSASFWVMTFLGIAGLAGSIWALKNRLDGASKCKKEAQKETNENGNSHDCGC